MSTNSKGHSKRGKRLYGTRETALIVGCPAWRIKNFAQPAYGLPPSQMLGSGRGSRRLYGFLDVMRLALADALVGCGFAPDAVGAAVREVPQSVFTRTDYRVGREPADTPVLVARHGEWRVARGGELKSLWRAVLDAPLTPGNLFALNIADVIEDAVRRLGDLEAEGKVRP